MTEPCIVVVEDEALIAADLEDALVHLGYRVPTTVATSTEAVQAVSDHRPDLVLLDITLAGSVDGITTAAAIRDIHTCPVVFLTAHSDGPTLARAKAVEPAGYLVKPFEERTLHATVEMALARGEAERMRRLKRAQLQAAVDQVDQAVFGVDAALKVRFVNAAAAEAGIALGQAVCDGMSAYDSSIDAHSVVDALTARKAIGLPRGVSVVFADEGAVVFLPRQGSKRTMLHLCAWCSRARGEDGWTVVESVLHKQYGISVSHGLCEGCAETQFGEVLT